jgi:protein-S-isoprenylcysteine O-methyltransferase Ste14
MNKKDYIGKVVISAKTKNRFVLTKIHAAYICVGTEKLNEYGTRSSYMFKNDNEDPFTSGALYFEDKTLNEKFKKEYKEYCFSENGRSESYMYWMLTCD